MTCIWISNNWTTVIIRCHFSTGWLLTLAMQRKCIFFCKERLITEKNISWWGRHYTALLTEDPVVECERYLLKTKPRGFKSNYDWGALWFLNGCPKSCLYSVSRHDYSRPFYHILKYTQNKFLYAIFSVLICHMRLQLQSIE